MNRLSLSQAVAQMRGGQLSPRDVVDACLSQIKTWEPHVNAWTHLDADGALQQADALAKLPPDQRRGLLWGAPIGVKDIVDVAGMPMRAGSPLLEQNTPTADAPLVQRLRDEGAIILGKTVTTQFACFDPSPTHNPWNLAHTPGGSSSGSAAAVASGMCLAAIGSQTGGSINRPAAYCGVAGMKPTFGAVDLRGVVPVTQHLDHVGPIAQNASDLSLMFAALTQSNAIDVGAPPEASTFFSLGGYFQTAATPEMWSAFESLREQLGVSEHLNPPPSFEQVHACHLTMMAVECADYHRPRYQEHADQYAKHVAQLIETGLAAKAIAYLAALSQQRIFRAELQTLLADRIAITPATDATAPDMSTTGNPQYQAPFSFAGVPSITIPAGLINGLPWGLRLIAAQGNEQRLLAAARWCEEQIQFTASPALA